MRSARLGGRRARPEGGDRRPPSMQGHPVPHRVGCLPFPRALWPPGIRLQLFKNRTGSPEQSRAEARLRHGTRLAGDQPCSRHGRRHRQALSQARCHTACCESTLRPHSETSEPGDPRFTVATGSAGSNTETSCPPVPGAGGGKGQRQGVGD